MGRSTGMNALKLLEDDHKKVKGLPKEIEPTTERAVKTREELFAKLRSELEVHEAIEEEIFYPALKENLEHHIEEEESEMFNQARKVFEQEELVELGDRMSRRKDELMGTRT
jgi:hypothetical protein